MNDVAKIATFEIGGGMKLIPLTRGRVALVDEADFEWLSQWNWCYGKNAQ